MRRRPVKPRVGGIRPSQLLMTFGVGSIVDLPKLSVMVMGLEDWPVDYSQEISEPRVLAAVRRELGSQVQRLYTPPMPSESQVISPNPFDEEASVGVPVAPFPRWLLCPACRLLAQIGSGLFQLKEEPFRSERTRFTHPSCNKMNNPEVIPARFVVACENGHFDDFPWVQFVDNRNPCDGPELTLIERGVSGEAVDVRVTCRTCKATQTMAQAFGKEAERNPFPCTGRRPHLRDYESDGCDQNARTMLLGASNSWFGVSLTALSLPTGEDKLGQMVDEYWTVLGETENEQNIALLRKVGQLRAFAGFSDEVIWREIRKRREEPEEEPEGSDLKGPEWQILSKPEDAPQGENFKLSEVDVPEGFDRIFERVVLVERLREVRALTGFTRIDSPGDSSFPGDVGPRRAPLSRSAPRWVPASEIRGEGIFMQLRENEVASWVGKVRSLESDFLQAHRDWRRRRALDPDVGFPGIRYVLLHSFSHALIRQLALECGYATASIRERIYSRNPAEEGGPMAGILLYTAAPDSEGTLGGLVSLGKPENLRLHVDQALENAQLCPSDPLCAERTPLTEGLSLHGSACHACLFASETSCERGNRYLDRSVLVETLERKGFGWFGD